MNITDEERRLIAELMKALHGDATSPASTDRGAEIAVILLQVEMAQERKLQRLRDVIEAADGEIKIDVQLDYEGSRVAGIVF